MSRNQGYVKSYSHANRGEPFENFIEYAHCRYQTTGQAVMHKVPTKFLPIRGPRGQVISCKVDRQSCVDYLGRYKKTPVAVEAKHTEDKRIAFKRVEPHQAAFMDDWVKDPDAVALVLVSFELKDFYAIPWRFWKAGHESWARSKGKAPITIQAHGWNWTTPGMASVSQEQLLEEWKIKSGGKTGLDYLSIIDRMI